MKYPSLLLAIVALASSVRAQEDPGPSPTASVGCEPHGDHWHCDGPATPTSVSSIITPAVPSPTESVGCEPHGDHWHCDGPASTSVGESITATTVVTPTVPSPVESVGCEPHGDHWHCDGPAETTTTAAELSGFTTLTSATAAATSTRADEGNGAKVMSVQVSLMVGLAVVIAVLNL
ncbi:hypothetical protein MPDQ_007553 [Monascus purpureus]|uniref:Uncharacterized protein n=1 Tax=Monascus purpureus TaxID=5098 RepID=A0A507QRZ0_MONPU|nr:hypothetical protein MPDQ_007553 [Monascus purpureus]BDD58799.1 hypothetical protein MAP00_004051 [Monascus purpureus]